MGVYRPSRNIEASIIQYIEAELVGDWSNVSVEKSFARIYEIELDSICVRCGVTAHEKAEIGADSTTRTPQVLIDIFAHEDGIRLDLKDWLIEKLKGGMPYYIYTIVGGEIQSKVQDGRITVLSIDDIPVNFDADRDTLDVHDRHRHALTLGISLGKIET